MAHSSKKEFTNPFVNFLALAFIGYLVYWIFTDNYMKGKFIGATNPHQPAEESVAGKKEEKKNEFDINRLTSKSVAKGREVYNLSCKSCHGAEGKGDGPGSLTNPKPRNFHNVAEFKFGIKYEDLYNTITKGSPGTSMSPFEYLPEDDRIAVSHYIAKWIPGSGGDASSTSDAGSDSGNAAATESAPSPAIEVEWNDEMVAKASSEMTKDIEKKDKISSENVSAQLSQILDAYQKQVDIASYSRLVVNTDLIDKTVALKSVESFKNFINSNYVFTLTGKSFGTLTNSELRDLYNKVKSNSKN